LRQSHLDLCYIKTYQTQIWNSRVYCWSH
jgi:hypothetical protein